MATPQIMSKLGIILNGIIKENPTFVLMLGMCPTLATTTSAMNGLMMGLATMAVLICSNIVISLIKKITPDMVHIPVYIVVIATLVTIVQFLLAAYLPDVNKSLGLFIPLIVVNCIILGRAESFACKNNVLDSALDGIGIGLGFTIGLTLLGICRELLGAGTIFGATLLPADYNLLIFIAAIFVNNIVLSQFLGICPFLGVSQKVNTSLGMSAAVAFVMLLATLVTWLIQNLILTPLNLGYLQTLSFILVIAALVQMVEIILKKVSPPLYQALGVFLPLITTNCAVLGVAITVVQKDYSLLMSLDYAIASAIGFGLALVLFAGLREQLALANVPKGMRGVSITLVTASLLALAFMGFSGVDGGLKALFGIE